MRYRRRVNSTFGQRVKRCRELRGLSRNELDRRAKFAPGTTSRIERGERGAKSGTKLDTAQRYAKAMHVHVEYLLTENGPMELNDDPVPERARAIEVLRSDGRTGEQAIAYAMGLPGDTTKSALWWIDLIRAKDTEITLEAALSPPRKKRGLPRGIDVAGHRNRLSALVRWPGAAGWPCASRARQIPESFRGRRKLDGKASVIGLGQHREFPDFPLRRRGERATAEPLR